MRGRKFKTHGRSSKNAFSRVNTFIHDKHIKEIGSLMRSRRGITVKGILYSALEEYLNPETKGNLVEEFRVEHSNIKREIGRIRFTQDILLEVFVVFVKVWLCHTHDIPKEHQRAAWASMERRYAKFKDLVLEELKGDEKLFDVIEESFLGCEGEEEKEGLKQTVGGV